MAPLSEFVSLPSRRWGLPSRSQAAECAAMWGEGSGEKGLWKNNLGFVSSALPLLSSDVASSVDTRNTIHCSSEGVFGFCFLQQILDSNFCSSELWRNLA